VVLATRYMVETKEWLKFDTMALFPTTPLERPLRIAFLGTPEFAAVCLEGLMSSSHEVVGVVTAPDRPAGRGHRLQASEVKIAAEKHGLPILQPTNLKSPEFLADFNLWDADVSIVVAFRMLPEVVWDAPPYGTINLHASLLPNLRGAAPIHRAIMAGLTETGVTTFSLQHTIDTGDILLQRSSPIEPLEDTGALHDRLSILGRSLIVQTLNDLVAGELRGLPQNLHSNADSVLEAPKLFKPDCRIDWNQSCRVILDHIRGLHPYPKAWTPSPFGDLKILEASQYKSLLNNELSGTALAFENNLYVAVTDGWIQIEKLVPPGKRPMAGSEWINGLASQDLGVWNVTGMDRKEG
jgi:methionyl-tRNA formyltransferase